MASCVSMSGAKEGSLQDGLLLLRQVTVLQ